MATSAVPGCTVVQVNISPNTEGGRVAALIAAAAQCAAESALTKARAAGAAARAPCPLPINTATIGPYIPSESEILKAKTACLTFVSPATCVPQSTWITGVQACVLRNASDPRNPEARFAEFRGPVIPPICTPVPQEALNANVPKLQTSICQLPNRSDLPILPV